MEFTRNLKKGSYGEDVFYIKNLLFDLGYFSSDMKEIKSYSFGNDTVEAVEAFQRKNKDDKISTIIPYINRGEFIFCSEDEEFNKQIMDFAGQKYSVHDDAPDSAAEFFIRIDNIKTTHGFSIIYR